MSADLIRTYTILLTQKEAPIRVLFQIRKVVKFNHMNRPFNYSRKMEINTYGGTFYHEMKIVYL